MKRKLALLISLLILAASPARAQTWYALIPATAQAANLSITLPPGTTYRFGSATNNQWCTATAGSVAVTVSDWTGGFATDCDPDVQKEFDVLETAAAQTVTVSSSGSPSIKTVPALPPPPPPPAPASYPPIAFTPQTAYAFTVNSLSGSAPLTVGLTLQYGTIAISFTCTSAMPVVTAGGTAPFSCVPAAIPAPIPAAASN